MLVNRGFFDEGMDCAKEVLPFFDLLADPRSHRGRRGLSWVQPIKCFKMRQIWKWIQGTAEVCVCVCVFSV